MKTNRIFHYLCITVILIGAHCSNDPITSGTEITNGNCIGTIYNTDGSLAQGAVVRIIPDNYNPLSASDAKIDSTLTDADGQYSFDIKQSGYYTVTAEKGDSSCMQDSVPIQANAQTSVDNDTLEASGLLTGKIVLKPGSDPRSVIILILGTNVYTAPYDSTGAFSTPSLPAGTFTIRVFTTENGYGIVDTTIHIASGDTTECDIALPSTNLLTISDFTLTFDSTSMHTTLSWSLEDTISIKSFTLSRSIRGTIDTMFTIDRTKRGFVDDVVGCEGDTLKYYLSVIDNNSKERFRTVSPKIIPVSTIRLTREFDLFEKNPDLMETLDPPLYIMNYNLIEPTIHIDNNENIFITCQHRIIKTAPDGNITAHFTPNDDPFGSPYLQTDDSGNFYWIYTPNWRTVLVKLNDDLEVLNKFVVPDSFELYMNDDKISFAVSGDGTVFLLGYHFSDDGSIDQFYHIFVLDNYFTIINDYLIEKRNYQNACTRFGDIFIINETTNDPDYLNLLGYYDKDLNPVYRLYETALPDSNCLFFGGPSGILATRKQPFSDPHPLVTMMDTTGHLFGRKLLMDVFTDYHVKQKNIHFDGNGNFYCIDWSFDSPEGPFRVLRYSLVTPYPTSINATGTYPKDIKSW